MIKLPDLMHLKTDSEGRVLLTTANNHAKAQLKKAVRDFGNHLAAHFAKTYGRELFCGEIEDEIHALIKEIPE